jgi:transcriptional regulator with XRE-family HTH domain
MTFHEWLRCTIKNSGLTQRHIYETAGISKSSLDKWLAGTRYPKVAQLYTLCSIVAPDSHIDAYLLASNIIVSECGS